MADSVVVVGPGLTPIFSSLGPSFTSTELTDGAASDTSSSQSGSQSEESKHDTGGRLCQCRCFSTCTRTVKKFLEERFQWYGEFVGTHPLPFVMFPIFTLMTLGACLTRIEFNNNLEEIYYPIDNRASKERDIVHGTFPDMALKAFNVFSLSYPDSALSMLFISKGDDLLEHKTLKEIRGIINQVNEIKITLADGSVVKQNEYACARRAYRCVIDGEYVLKYNFLKKLANGSMTFPFWIDPEGEWRDLSSALSGVVTANRSVDLNNTSEGNKTVLVSAKVLLLSFKMAYVTDEGQKNFKELAARLNPKYSKMTYAGPRSMSEEIEETTGGDVTMFAITILMTCIYALMVSSGGDPVSTRASLAMAGVCATTVSILGSMGLLSLCGVEYISIVGVVPFLILGIGIDDMFLLMTGWSHTLGERDLSVSQRLGRCMKGAGVSITITSLTDALAFAIGTSSVFRAIITFSLYAGLAVLFCYLTNATLFLACLAFHGRRVYDQRHFLTCRLTHTRENMKTLGANACLSFLCGGHIPVHNASDESLCERIPRLYLPLFVEHRLLCAVIVLLFMGYMGLAIYGVINLQQGLQLHDLVRSTSYYYDYLINIFQYFPISLPIGLIVNGTVDYSGPEGDQLMELMRETRQDPMVMLDFERCWLPSYLNSPFYNESTPELFVLNLAAYINATPDFQGDVVLDSNLTVVTASRCFVLSEKSNDQYGQADMMYRLRVLVDNSSLPVFVYHSTFLQFEQFHAILPATLKMLGMAVFSMGIVTSIFMPQVGMVILVVLTIVMILTGIIGFMFIWDITLSPITMIHLVMSVGFSVDFSAHVCAAYLLSNKPDRQSKAKHALRHAAAPVMNGALSTLVGIMFLVFSESYVFVTFFKIMVLAMVLGLLHAVFFLPAILSLIGPQESQEEEEEEKHQSVPHHTSV